MDVRSTGEGYRCCTNMKTKPCYLVVFGIRIPATLCESCGEVMDNCTSLIDRIKGKILFPFWSGMVLVEIEEEEGEW